MYTRFGEVKFEFPATAALKSEHQGPRFLVPIISRLWPSCVIILAFLVASLLAWTMHYIPALENFPEKLL